MRVSRRKLKRIIEQEQKKLSSDEIEAAKKKISDEGGALGLDDLIKTVEEEDPDKDYKDKGEVLDRLSASIENFNVHVDGDAYTNEPAEKADIRLSEGLRYHSVNNIPIIECIYRPGSKAFMMLIREARALYEAGELSIHQEDLELIESDLGKWGMYQGHRVPLDFPMLEDVDLHEAKYKGREVKLGAKGAQRAGGGKAYVYVRDPKTKKIKRVKFGSTLPDAMGDSKAHKKRRKSFGLRHRCADKKDKTKPGYWACRATKMFGRSIPGWW